MRVIEMICVDTSVWVALYLNEPHTTWVQAWMASCEAGGSASAERVKTGYASAWSIKRRRGCPDRARFTQARHGFARICAGGVSWLDVDTVAFTTAAGPCADPASRLRAGDALHVVVAVRSKCKALSSVDNVMNENARLLGLEAIRP